MLIATGMTLIVGGSAFEKLEAVPRSSAALPDLLNKLCQIFELFDTDRTGYITASELRRMLAAMAAAPVHITPGRLALTIM